MEIRLESGKSVFRCPALVRAKSPDMLDKLQKKKRLSAGEGLTFSKKKKKMGYVPSPLYCLYPYVSIFFFSFHISSCSDRLILCPFLVGACFNDVVVQQLKLSPYFVAGHIK